MPVHDSVSSRSLAYNSSILVRRSIDDGSVSSSYLAHVKQEKPSTGKIHLLIVHDTSLLNASLQPLAARRISMYYLYTLSMRYGSSIPLCSQMGLL